MPAEYKVEKEWGFYGGNKVQFDGRGFYIISEYNNPCYLEYNEMSSLVSLMNKILFRGKGKNKKNRKVNKDG